MSNSPKQTPEQLLSLNSLSRKLDLSYPRASILLCRGVLKPDFMAQGSYLFRLSRLDEIREELTRLPNESADLTPHS